MLKTPSLACTVISPSQTIAWQERPHSQCPLLYCECVLSIHCELLNHLLTTAWRELRQWLVNTLEWMKGLGIKWQDVLKEEQVVVVVEEGPVKPCRRGTSCISMWLFFSIFMLCLCCSRSFTLVSSSSSLAARFPPLLSPHLHVFYLYCPLMHNQRSLLLNSALRQLTFMRLDIPVQPHSYVQWAKGQKPPHTP